jgi:hypothetical protein
MDSKPQDRTAKRSLGWALVASTLVAGGLGAGRAWADIHVNVMSCTSAGTVEAQAYNAEDSVKMVAASTKKLSQSGQSATMTCAGQEKGYCQMVIVAYSKPVVCANTDYSSGIGGHVSFNLQKDKWAVITGFVAEGSTCKPVVQENLSSGSCSSQ